MAKPNGTHGIQHRIAGLFHPGKINQSVNADFLIQNCKANGWQSVTNLDGVILAVAYGSKRINTDHESDVRRMSLWAEDLIWGLLPADCALADLDIDDLPGMYSLWIPETETEHAPEQQV